MKTIKQLTAWCVIIPIGFLAIICEITLEMEKPCSEMFPRLDKLLTWAEKTLEPNN